MRTTCIVVLMIDTNKFTGIKPRLLCEEYELFLLIAVVVIVVVDHHIPKEATTSDTRHV
jgi:hypothetical protein